MLFTCLTAVFITSISAQKIEKFYNYKWEEVGSPALARFYSITEKKDSVWDRKDFYLRESKLQMQGFYKDQNADTPHGHFSYFHSNGNLLSHGQYINGKKTGLWLSFHTNQMMSDSVFYDESGRVIGTRVGWHSNGYMSDSTFIQPDGSGIRIGWFDNGIVSEAGYFGPGHKQKGKWKYFHSNGQLSSLELYDNGKLVNKEYFDENGVKQNDTTNRDRNAMYPGGMKAWQKHLEKKMYFPPQYKITNSDQVVVIVSWQVDEEGKVKDVEVTSSFHPQFDKIAVEVIKSSPKWLPAISHNRKIKQYPSQPVTFSQESESE